MITLILPGYSAHNKEWAEEVAKNLNPPAGGDWQIRPIFWDHWDDPSQKFEARQKADLLIKHSKGEKLNLVAKSIGTLVATYIADEIPDQINKIILCGIPVGSLSEENIKLISQIQNNNLVVFQNNKDPLSNLTEVKNFFPNFKIVEKESDTHDYPYFEEFNSYLTS